MPLLSEIQAAPAQIAVDHAGAAPAGDDAWLADGPHCLWIDGVPLIVCATCPDSTPAVAPLGAGRRVQRHLRVHCPACGRELARALT